jgi:DNA-directed RNA polymerase specialized sigma24 family protein
MLSGHDAHDDDAHDDDGAEARAEMLVEALRARRRGLHHERTRAFLLRLSGRRGDASELFQQVWLAAAQHAERLDEARRRLRWLFAIARNGTKDAAAA